MFASADLTTARARRPSSAPPTWSRRHMLLALLAVVLAQLTATYFVAVPGVIVVDEVAYHFMTRAVADGTAPEIWNGFDEVPSQELAVRITRTIVDHDGRLIAKYPYLGPLLAAPLYRPLGAASLIVVNSLAFALCIVLTWDIARRFTSDRIALLACAIFVFATYAWQYSQALWPHSLALAFILCGVAALLRCTPTEAPARQVRWAALSGLSLGLGAGARLDVLLALGATAAALALWCLARPRQVRWGPLVGFGIGAAPGVLALGYLNLISSGRFSPFLYAPRNLDRFVPLILLMGVLLSLGVVIPRWVLPEFETHRGRGSVVALTATLVIGAIVLLALPASRHLLVSALRGLYVLVVDLSALDPGRLEPAMRRGDDGAVIYMGAFKKALLQSCSFLPIVFVGARVLHARRLLTGLGWILVLLPVTYLVGFSVRAWHGAVSLNLRYYLPILPLLSIFTAVGFARIAQTMSSQWRLGAGAVALAAGAVYAYALATTEPLAQVADFWVLTLPLLLTSTITLLTAVFSWQTSALSRAVQGPLLTLVATSLIISALIAFAYDYRYTRRQRALHATMTRGLMSQVEPDSLVFTPYIDPAAGLIDAQRVRLANPAQDRFATFGRLVQYHRRRRRAVYVFAPTNMLGFPAYIGRHYPLRPVFVSSVYGLFVITDSPLDADRQHY